MAASRQSIRVLAANAEFKRLKKRIALLEDRLISKAVDGYRKQSKSPSTP